MPTRPRTDTLSHAPRSPSPIPNPMPHRALRFARPLLIALLAGGLAPRPAHALQEPVDSSAVLLPGIRVEVLRARLLAAAPWALSVRDGADLRADRGGVLLDDALRGIPGLQVQSRFNPAVGDRIAIRGFGGRSQFGIRGLRIVVDGIPATLPDGQSSLDHLDPSTLQRVEVLRGPGAAFWGNAAGGVLAFETRLPEPGARDRVRIRTGAGSHGTLDGTASWGGSLRNGSFEVSTGLTRTDGYRGTSDGVYGESSRWTGSGRLRLPVAGGELAVALSALELSADNPGSLPESLLDDASRPAWGFNVASGTGKEVTQGQLGASWSRGDTGPSFAAWTVTRDVLNPIPGTIIDLDRTVFGARAAWSGGSGGWGWNVSTEAERQADDRRNFGNDGGLPDGLTLDQAETVTALAAAAQLSHRSGPLLFSAAARIDRTRFEADDRLVAAGDPDDSGERTMTALSPSLGVSWRAAESVTVFGSVGSFFETPTTTELANRPEGSGGFNPDLDPRRGWNGEVGVRTAVSTRSVVVTGEVVGFFARVRDELVPFEVANDPGRTFYRNAGRSRSRGVEASADLRSFRGHGARLTWTRTDARFVESDGDDRGLAGNRIPGIAPNRLDLSVDGGVRALRFGADLRRIGEIPVDDAGTAQAPASTVLDLRAEWSTLVGRTRIMPWVTVRNVTDELWVSSVVVNAFGGRYYEPGPGRTLDVGLTMTIGAGRR